MNRQKDIEAGFQFNDLLDMAVKVQIEKESPLLRNDPKDTKTTLKESIK